MNRNPVLRYRSANLPISLVGWVECYRIMYVLVKCWCVCVCVCDFAGFSPPD